MRKVTNAGGSSVPSTNILKHSDDDIFVKNPIFMVFEN